MGRTGRSQRRPASLQRFVSAGAASRLIVVSSRPDTVAPIVEVEGFDIRRILGRALVLAVFAFVAGASGCGGEDGGNGGAGSAGTTTVEAPETVAADADTSKVDHPFWPLTTVREWVYEGSEGGTEMRVEMRVLDRTETVAGIEAAVVEVHEYESGKLVEHTFDYYAQTPDGDVLYMGEDVDDIQGGKVVAHKGEWRAGQDDAKPGLFIPADPKVGEVFEQERAPGVAEDRSTVVVLGVKVKVPADAFSDCMKTEDFAPLDNATEFKFYCRGVGLVREEAGEDTHLDLVRYTKR